MESPTGHTQGSASQAKGLCFALVDGKCTPVIVGQTDQLEIMIPSKQSDTQKIIGKKNAFWMLLDGDSHNSCYQSPGRFLTALFGSQSRQLRLSCDVQSAL